MGRYPNRTLEQFKELHQGDVRGVSGLTEDEYKYATQVAVWATCGQLAVSGTAFTAGRATLVEPTSDAQQIRVYDSVKAILSQAQGWSKTLYTGMYLRAEEDRDVRGVEIINEAGLEGAAQNGTDGIKKETINGKEYFTRVIYVASATSTYIDGYTTKVYSTDAPILRQENGKPLRPDSITFWLNNFSKRHGLPHINPHAFRHTAASVMIVQGTDIVTISKMLGHAKVSTTEDIYSHVIEDSKQQAANVLASVYYR